MYIGRCEKGDSGCGIGWASPGVGSPNVSGMIQASLALSLEAITEGTNRNCQEFARNMGRCGHRRHLGLCERGFFRPTTPRVLPATEEGGRIGL